MSLTLVRRVAAVAAGTALVAGGLVSASAQAATPTKPLAACHWVMQDKANTFDCGKLSTSQTTVPIVLCWKNPLSDQSYVEHFARGAWTKGGATLRVAKGGDCGAKHPWRSVVTVPVGGLKPMGVARYRLVIPAFSGDDGGSPFSYSATSVVFGVCLVPEGTTTPCAG